METIERNIAQVRERIAQACARSCRDAQNITLLAVSKTRPAHEVAIAHRAGLQDFGENYVQEALEKMALLAAQRAQLRWHLIGPLQSNKTRMVAAHFDWVHSLDRLQVAERLSQQRSADLAPLQVCVQVNISHEARKGGVSLADAGALCAAVAGLPRLQLRGLMAIPAPGSGRGPHQALAQALAKINTTQGLAMDVLSMGMSDDLEDALAEGATIVRVGTALFGPRAAQGQSALPRTPGP